jgi:hypothetical protein
MIHPQRWIKMIGGALTLIIAMASTPTEFDEVVQITILPSGNGHLHLATCQRRRRVINIFSRDLVADRNDVASLGGALVSHNLPWTWRQKSP